MIFGCGITATIANSLVVGAAPAERAGTAAGLSESTNQLGTAIGIAVFGTLASAIYRTEMASEATYPRSARSLSDATEVARTLPRLESSDLLDRGYAAYVSGLSTVAIIAAVLAGALAVLLSLVCRESSSVRAAVRS